MKRDRTLEAQISPPEGMSASEVRQRWPGAAEQLEEFGSAGILLLEEGELVFEHVVSSSPLTWRDGCWYDDDAGMRFDGRRWVPS